MVPMQLGKVPLLVGKIRPPHQRAVTEHPKIVEIRCHRVGMRLAEHRAAGSRQHGSTQWETSMAEAVNALQTRHSRFGLFAPFVLLGLLAAGWSIAWLIIRQRTADGLDAWLASEVAVGRQWTCADRAVGGYPFRIEVSCGMLSLKRGEATASLGGLLAVAQVYRPGHVIAEISGPLRASDGEDAAVEAEWRLLQASIQSASDAFQRASLVIE